VSKRGGIRGLPKEIQQAIYPMIKEGWTLEKTKAKHAKLVSPSGKRKIPIPSSRLGNGQHRLQNYLKMLQRYREEEEAGGPP